ncbi:hypothetical protein Tco_1358508, partial [Tanacetum coccineum]
LGIEDDLDETKRGYQGWFQYLVRRIGVRCLTPAELDVLTNESA